MTVPATIVAGTAFAYGLRRRGAHLGVFMTIMRYGLSFRWKAAALLRMLLRSESLLVFGGCVSCLMLEEFGE